MTTEQLEQIFDPEKNSYNFDQAAAKYSQALESSKLNRSIAGVDLYRYGSYQISPQSLIPFVMNQLFDNTMNHLKTLESAFFTVDDITAATAHAVHTGDGYLVPFQTPFQALLFCFYFQANLYQHNSLNSTPNLAGHFTEPLSIRYAVTCGIVVEYDDRYFGPAMISNARILSLDRLNRLLLDHHTVDWFRTRTNGVETLQMVDVQELSLTRDIVDDVSGASMLFSLDNDLRRIKSIDILKIGDVEPKGDPYDVYSLHAQLLMRQGRHVEIDKYVVTVGNLNSTGLGT